MLPKILSLLSIVVILFWMFYFLAGGLPLLILKHEDPADSRMVCGFFNVHYLVLMSVAAISVASSAFAGRYVLAAAAAGVLLVGFLARQMIALRMYRLRNPMGAVEVPAVRGFRRLHVAGLTLNVLLIAGFVSTLSLASAEIVNCAHTPPGCTGEACRVLCSLL